MYSLLINYIDQFHFLNILRYLTFRTSMALLTGMMSMFILTPKLIAFLKKVEAKQPVRDYLHNSKDNMQKSSTPTMGGLAVIVSITISILVWGNLHNNYILILLFTIYSLGGIGLLDDIRKITKKNHYGTSGKRKFLIECAIAIVVIYLANMSASTNFYSSALIFPFLKNFTIDSVIFYTIIRIFTIVGAANAVNLTDGLDGLAAVPIMFTAACMWILAYLIGNTHHAEYLLLHYIEGSGEIAVFAAAIIGSLLGFLWYNCKPAEIFMGDTGSLALGGLLGTMAIILKQEFILIISGGVFVVETLSVILQVLSFKTRGKRIFKMAPLHHHFELLGWSETKIVVRFWIVAIVFSMISLLTLKIR